MSKLLHTIKTPTGRYEIYAGLQVGETIRAGDDTFTVTNEEDLAMLKDGKLPKVVKPVEVSGPSLEERLKAAEDRAIKAEEALAEAEQLTEEQKNDAARKLVDNVKINPDGPLASPVKRGPGRPKKEAAG